MNTEMRKTILVVEDDPALLKVLVKKIQDEGFEAISATNGLDGFKEATTKKPDLILLDIVLPVMDGMTMMRKLREENEWGREVPIVLLTNLSVDDEKIRAVAKDEPAYYLVKSDWSLDDVIKKIKERVGV